MWMQSFGYQGHSLLIFVGLAWFPHMEFTLVKICHMGSFKSSTGTGAARTLGRGAQERCAACEANQLEMISRAMEATLFVLNPSRNLFTLSMVPFGDTVVHRVPFRFL